MSMPVEADLLEKATRAWRDQDLDIAVRAARRAGRLPGLTPGDALRLAWILMSTGQLDDARVMLRRSLVRDPAGATALARLGQISRVEGRLDAAVKVLGQALAIAPMDTEVTRSLGQCLESLERTDRAIGIFRQGAASDQAEPEDRTWLAHALMRVGRPAEADRLLHEAALAKGGTDKRLRNGLQQGSGLPLHIRGDPEDLATAVYHARWLATWSLDKRLTVQTSPRLITTMERSFPAIRFTDAFAPDSDAVAIDRQSLPHLLGRPSAGATGPFLKSDPDRRRHWREALHGRLGAKPLIGISWRSSLTLRQTRFDAPASERLEDLDRQMRGETRPAAQLWRKQIPLAALRCILEEPSWSSVSIQYGLDQAEVEHLGRRHGLTLTAPNLDFLGDMDDVVAFIDALDAVVTIPNTHAHIAAALGKPTLVLVHDVPVPYWGLMRYLAHYPKAEIIEKPTHRRADGVLEHHYAGDWTATAASAKDRLRAWSLPTTP